MNEFVDLSNEEPLNAPLDIKINSPCNCLEEIVAIDIKPEEPPAEQLCVKDCDNSIYYGCSEDGYFKIENLFSELTTEYQKAVIRENLNLSEGFMNKWGTISGDITKQKDLVLYLEALLKEKANVKSPVFLGEPLSTKPGINDNSNRIATTEWVIEKIGTSGGGGGSSSNTNIVSFTVTPEYAYLGDGSVNVNISWVYRNAVTSQTINSQVLNISDRSYSLTLDKDTIINLTFESNSIQESKIYLFKFHIPIYYGDNDNYLLLNRTIEQTIKYMCNVDKYVYLLIANNKAVINVNGFTGGFKMLNRVIIFNTDYYIYKSVNKSLGKLIINIS